MVGSRPRACRPTPRSTSAPARCCSSTTPRSRRTCTTASSTPRTSWCTTPRCRCPAHACRTTWRSRRITRSSTTARCSGTPNCCSAASTRCVTSAICRPASLSSRGAVAPTTSAGSRPIPPMSCTGSTRTRTATKSCSTASSRPIRARARRPTTPSSSRCSASSTSPGSSPIRTAGGSTFVPVRPPRNDSTTGCWSSAPSTPAQPALRTATPTPSAPSRAGSSSTA